MVKNIQDIFDSITPENIKNTPVIQDAMEIFIETLEELCQESIDIKNIFNNDVIKNELFEIYLDDLYRTLNSVSTNKQLLDAIDKVNDVYNPPGLDPSDPDYISFIKRDAIANISKYINDEQFLTFKSYKEHKGTEIAIKYIYELLNIFTDTSIAENTFSITTGDVPFNLEIIHGSLPPEFYEYIIRPLAHPLGFLYTYSKLITLFLEDYFPELSITYDVDLLRVVCLQTDGSIEYVTFIDKNAEPPLIDLSVVTIKNYNLEDSRIQEIYLDNNNYLQQTTTNLGQTSVSYFDEHDTLIEEFEGQCSIEMVYTQIIKTTVTDECIVSQEPYESDTFPVDEMTEFLGFLTELKNASEEHTELDSLNGKWWDLISDEKIYNIGDDGWIYYKTITLEEEGESYMQLGIFDQRSDDDFDFGVWRDGERLADNNVSALP